MVFQGIPSELRAKFWSKCTGLQSYKSNYVNNYYQTLCDADADKVLDEYPNPHFAQIDKDMSRTFPNDHFYTPEVKESMRRVFRAYVWRNPTVGYI